MSEQLTLSAEARDRAGKGASRAMRREGRVPAVVYGDKQDPLSIHLEATYGVSTPAFETDPRVHRHQLSSRFNTVTCAPRANGAPAASQYFEKSRRLVAAGRM